MHEINVSRDTGGEREGYIVRSNLDGGTDYGTSFEVDANKAYSLIRTVNAGDAAEEIELVYNPSELEDFVKAAQKALALQKGGAA
jgi:hypothetical protein